MLTSVVVMANEVNDKGAEKHLMWSMHRCNEPKRKYESGEEERRREIIRHNAHTTGFEDWKRATNGEIGAGRGAARGARCTTLAPTAGPPPPRSFHNHRTFSRHLFHCNISESHIKMITNRKLIIAMKHL